MTQTAPTATTDEHIHDWKLDVGTRYRCSVCMVYSYARVTNYISGHGAAFDHDTLTPYKCNALKGASGRVADRPQLCSEPVVELRGSLKLCAAHSKSIVPSKDPHDIEHRAACNREERRVEERNADAFRRLAESTNAVLPGRPRSF